MSIAATITHENGGHGSATTFALDPRSSRRRATCGRKRARTSVDSRTLNNGRRIDRRQTIGMRPGGHPVRNSPAKDGQVSREPLGKDAGGQGGS